MLENQLSKLGFSPNEVKVYLTLFELGKVRAGGIIESTGLHRNIVYTALEELIKRELVTKTMVGGVAEYVANEPDNLVREIEQKKQLAKQVAEELKKKQTEKPREIIVYEGFEGIKKSREKVFNYKKGDELYVLGASSLSSTPEYEKYWKKFHQRRESLGIGLKILYESRINRADVEWRKNLLLTKVKYLPPGLDSPVWFAAIGDNLEIGVPSDNPLIFNIRSRQAVEGVKKYFDYLWNQEVIVESGIDAMQRSFYNMLNELKSGEEYYVLGTVQSSLPEYKNFFDDYHRARIKKGVRVKMLSYEEDLATIRERFFVKCGDPEGKISFIRPFVSASPIPMQITLYKNKATMIMGGTNPTVFYFDRSDVFDGFKKYFDALWQQESYVISGPEAVQKMWLEAVEAGELLFIGARGYFVDQYPKMFAEVVTAARKKAGVKWKVVTDEGVRGHYVTTLPWVETKYVLPKVPSPNVVWLYGSTVAVVNWSEDQPIIFISKNPHLIQSYRDYFYTMWNKK